MSKLLVFAYGVISSAVFFVTYLYAVGFVGNLVVPKSLDSAPTAPFGMALAINLGLLALFAVQHSVMARPVFKRLVLGVLPQAAERSTYVLASSLALILLFWQWSPLGGGVWDVQDTTARAVLYGLFGFGFLLVLVPMTAKRASQVVRTASGVGALVLISLTPTHVFAQDHSHAAMTSDHRNLSALVQAVREATERFKDVEAAKQADYELLFGCVSGPDYGAMGLHYVNLGLVFDGGELDPAHPEIILYEPLPNGRLRITGADFLVIAKDWDDKHPGDPPQLMGQLFHRFESPNRFGLPDFYTLHVWAWKDSPTGTFSNWHSNISCDGFKAQ